MEVVLFSSDNAMLIDADGTVPLADGACDCCAEDEGACCFPDGSCSVTTSTLCSQGGGTFQGVGTACTPNPCPPPDPIGACCRPAELGGCFVNTAAVCQANGGTYIGDGTDCLDCPADCCNFAGTNCWVENSCGDIVWSVTFAFTVTQRCSNSGACSVWQFNVSDTVPLTIAGLTASQEDCPFPTCRNTPNTIQFVKDYTEQAEAKNCSGGISYNCWPQVGFVYGVDRNQITVFRGRIQCSPNLSGSQQGETTMGTGCREGTLVPGMFNGPSAGPNCGNLPSFQVNYLSGSYTVTNRRDCGAPALRSDRFARSFSNYTTSRGSGLLIPKARSVRAATPDETLAVSGGCGGCTEGRRGIAL